MEKSTQWKSDTAKENLELLQDFNARSFAFRKNAYLMEGARYNEHFSKAEIDTMLLMRQAPIPIPISTAIMDTAEALMLQSKPAVNVAHLVFPQDEARTEMSRLIAQKYRFLVQNDWHNSHANLQFDRILADQSNVGIGYAYIVPRFEYGEFFTEIKRLPWRYVFPDPDSTDIWLEDQSDLLYAFPMTRKAAFRYLRSFIPTLSESDFEKDWCKGDYAEKGTAFFESDRYMSRGKAGTNLLFINRMTLEDQLMYLVIPRKANIKSDSGEFPVHKYKVYPEITPELEEQAGEGLIEIREKRDLYLTHHISLGNNGFKKIYPIRQINVVPLMYDHRDNPFPYSRMWYVYPAQRGLNKFFASALLNFSLLNATRVLAENDSIINEDEWVTNASTPGAILKYQLPIPGISKPPDIIKAEPLHNEWLTLPRYLTYIMEYASGMWGIMQGNQEGSPDVFSTVASLQSAGGTKIKRRLTHVDAFMSRVGNICAEIYKNYAPPNGYSSAIDAETGSVQTESYNTLEIIKKNDIYRLQTKPETDLGFGIREVRFSSASASGFESANMALALTTLATQLSVPELIPDILKLYNLANIEETIKKIESRTDAQQQVAQYADSMKRLEGQNKVFQNQIFQLAKTLEAAKAKGKADVILTELKSSVDAIMSQFQQ